MVLGESQGMAVGHVCHYSGHPQPNSMHLISTGPRSREERHSNPPKHAGVEIREITLPQQKPQVKKKYIKEQGALLNHQTLGSLVNARAVNSWGAQDTFSQEKLLR